MKYAFNSKKDKPKYIKYVYSMIIGVALILIGTLITSYMILSGQISTKSENIAANTVVFFASFIALLLARGDRGERLLLSGAYTAGMLLLFLITDMLFLEGVTYRFWERLLAMVLASLIFVIIRSKKRSERYMRKGHN